MAILNYLAWAFLTCLIIFAVGLIFGIIVENYLDDNNPLKKWWRKHIVDDDPYDDEWKKFGN